MLIYNKSNLALPDEAVEANRRVLLKLDKRQ